MSRLRVLVVAMLPLLVACEDRSPAVGPMASGTGVREFDVAMLEFPGARGSAQVHLAPLANGRTLMSWLEPAGDAAHALRYAVLDATGWSAAGTVIGGERFFVNWADFPSVVPVTADFWVAHWLQLQPDSFGAYDGMIAVSNDAGRSWSAGARLNEDKTEAEHGFVEIYATDGEANAFWLDGRELVNWSFDDPEALLGVSLRVATVSADGSIANRQIVDALVCDCCQPDVAVGSRGALVTYRDRTEDEIRDIAYRRLTADGWSDATDVSGEGWYIEGCPVNGPAIAAVGEHAVIAWFTAADAMARVRIARSADGGLSFGAPRDVDADGALGQVDVVIDSEGGALVSWWRRGASDGIDLAVRRISVSGDVTPIQIIAHEEVSQPIDVPQLSIVPGGALLAWTSLDGDGNVNTARISLP